MRIALVGKYVQLEDAYLSVSEALRHAASMQDAKVQIDWIDSEALEGGAAPELLGEADGILIPGGFGGRGIEGKIAAAGYARREGIPYLGICLGMQVAVAEFARNVAEMEGANSTEFDIETPHPVIDLLPEQKEVADLGGTMRLGADPIKLHRGTVAREMYGEAVIYERHRHRYEVNNLLRKRLTNAAGARQRLKVSGTSPDERLVELIELEDHPFFVASQFHPEFKSRPERPLPLFHGFVAAALQRAGGGQEPPDGEDGEADARRCTTRALDRRVSEIGTLERRYLSGTFAELCRIESPSGSERRCAERVAAELRALGVEMHEDDAGRLTGSDCGNLLGRLPAARRGADGDVLRPPRHRPSAGPGRAGADRGRVGERQRGDPGGRQQGGRGGAAGARPHAPRGRLPGGARAAVHGR